MNDQNHNELYNKTYNLIQKMKLSPKYKDL